MLQIVLAVLVVNKIIKKSEADVIFSWLKGEPIPKTINDCIEIYKKAQEKYRGSKDYLLQIKKNED